MAGWLVLTHANDAYEKFETPGESRIEIAKNGYPEQRVLADGGVVTVEWFAEEPEVKGKTVAEAAAEEEAAAAAPEEEEATKTASTKK